MAVLRKSWLSKAASSAASNITVPQKAWISPANLTTDRDYDADSTSTAELADVVGTLITALISAKILAADNLLLEGGDFILLETGDKIKKED